MNALMIIDLSPLDQEKLGEYSAMAAETLVPYGGEYIAKGPIESLQGNTTFSTKVVIQFPDREKALNWYQSDAYQSLIPIRDQAMHSQFHLIG